MRLKKEPEERALGLRFLARDDGFEVVEVLRFSRVAAWNLNCVAHVAVTPGDVITHINDAAVEDMRAELARPGFKTGPVLLTLRRHTLTVPTPPLRPPRVPEPPPSKTQMRKLVSGANDIQPLVCCRCKRHTFPGGPHTQGQWALWHLDRCHS